MDHILITCLSDIFRNHHHLFQMFQMFHWLRIQMQMKKLSPRLHLPLLLLAQALLAIRNQPCSSEREGLIDTLHVCASQ